jgi:hypothetical protein
VLRLPSQSKSDIGHIVRPPLWAASLSSWGEYADTGIAPAP